MDPIKITRKTITEINVELLNLLDFINKSDILTTESKERLTEQAEKALEGVERTLTNIDFMDLVAVYNKNPSPRYTEE